MNRAEAERKVMNIVNLMSNLLKSFSPEYVIIPLGWAGLMIYKACADRRGQTQPSLLNSSEYARLRWGKMMAVRENRIVDAALIGSLTNVATFFASTTILVIGALIALCASPERMDELRQTMGNIPLSAPGVRASFELRVFAISSFFLYAFFKFTWAIRQLNFTAILVGAMPKAYPGLEESQICKQFSNISCFAGHNFNMGLRCIYWAFASSTWLWNPWASVPAFCIVAYVLWAREFESNTMKALSVAFEEGDTKARVEEPHTLIDD